MTLKLQKISISNTLNVFHIAVKKDTSSAAKHMTLLSDTEQVDDFLTFKGKYNKNSLYDNYGNIYYNMYDSSTPIYKSYFYKKSKTLQTGTASDFQDIYNHKLSSLILDSVQIQNFIYMLEPNSVYGHLALSTDIMSWISSDNGQVLPKTNKIETVLYNKNKLIENIKNNILSDNAISEKLTNTKYNMIYEVPGNVYNDYESGIIAAMTFKGKNQYDCEYSMNHLNNKLQYIRNYIGIDSCNNLLYLKYNNKDFIATSSSQLTVESPTTPNKYGMYLPSIEVIKRINRTISNNNHSTTLYSINIDIRKIFNNIKTIDDTMSLTQLDEVKENITHEIRNCVRAIAETILPANVLLYHVYVNGE